jgi:hypothetical protein
MENSQVDKVIHSICQRGCKYVNTVLQESCETQGCQELQKLNRVEQSLVIEELKSVMSVYNQTGSCKV